MQNVGSGTFFCTNYPVTLLTIQATLFGSSSPKTLVTAAPQNLFLHSHLIRGTLLTFKIWRKVWAMQPVGRAPQQWSQSLSLSFK
jgi:hypothetical protein